MFPSLFYNLNARYHIQKHKKFTIRSNSTKKEDSLLMRKRFIIEYSEDEDEVCIIPFPHIPLDHFCEIVKTFGELGYKWWIPADERCGYRYIKNKERYGNELLPENETV
jgi:hypothetical protein